MSNRSIWPIDRTLSSAATSGQDRHESDSNEGVLSISQSSSITGASPSDSLVSYKVHSLGESYPLSEMQSVYSAAQADWANRTFWNHYFDITVKANDYYKCDEKNIVIKHLYMNLSWYKKAIRGWCTII